MIAFFSERLFYLTGVKRNMDEGAVSLFGFIENKWYDASWFPFNDQGAIRARTELFVLPCVEHCGVLVRSRVGCQVH